MGLLKAREGRIWALIARARIVKLRLGDETGSRKQGPHLVCYNLFIYKICPFMVYQFSIYVYLLRK